MVEVFRSDNVVARAIACEDISRWVVTFDNYSIGHEFDREGFAQSFLKSNGISAIHIMGKREDWYQYPEMPDVFSAVKPLLQSADRSITYGSSMGGYAALRFADSIGVDAALALSPQYSINPARVTFEKRWLQDAERITWLPEGEPPLPRRAQAVVVYDPASVDRMHIDLISKETEVVSIPVRYSGHPSGSMLAEQQMLFPLLLDVLSGTVDATKYRRAARSRRDESVTYLINLSDAAAAKRRDVALRLAERAINVQPTHVGALQSLARNLYAQGRNEEALSAYEKALEISRLNVVVAVPYASLLSDLGQHQPALAIAREIASKPETKIMAHIQAWYGFIAQQAGEQVEAVEAVRRAVVLHPTEETYQKLFKAYQFEVSPIGQTRALLTRLRDQLRFHPKPRQHQSK